MRPGEPWPRASTLSQVKAEAKQVRRLQASTNFETVARAWFDHWKGPRSPPPTPTTCCAGWKPTCSPAVGRKPVSEVTAPQLLAMAKRIESRGAVDIAKRALQTCGQIPRYAVAHGLLERNPAAAVKPSDALKPRKKENYARLDAKEVPQLLRKIDAYQGAPTTRLAKMLMALTFVRTGALIGARWVEFDLAAAEWRIRGGRPGSAAYLRRSLFAPSVISRAPWPVGDCGRFSKPCL